VSGVTGKYDPRERPDLAIFVATSGHSGVDTVVAKLLAAFGDRGLNTHVLKIRGHGPYINEPPKGSAVAPLPSRHVETSLPSLVRYLRRYRPRALLTDKDSVNRLAIIARATARVDTRLVVRLGTTVSVNLRDKRWLPATLQAMSIRWLYRFADACVVPSHGAAQDLATLMRTDVDGIHVLPNPVVDHALDEAAAMTPDEPWLDESRERPVIVAAGSLTERKDYATLLRAFARVRRHRECRLIIIGRGRCRPSLEAQAAQLGIADDVRFTGFLENPYPLIRSADVFAHSSRWEGLGIVLIEALALGTPVVATDCPSGPREILAGGGLGRLVAVGDDAAMAEAILSTLSRPPDPAGLRAGVAHYSVAASANAYAALLGLTGGDDGR
jgi:glycosyltransferase involved in cell wall biosynthesis